MNLYIQKILTKEMTRKEFLTYFGLLILTVFGISALLKNISKLSPTKKQKVVASAERKSSFGTGGYGV